MKYGKLFNIAFGLSIFTIIYNIAEGLVSVYYGASDDTLALLGFGMDSFVEVISGAGIAHMILRMKRNAIHHRAKFEKQALRITGIAMYLLAGGIVIGAVFNIFAQSKPVTTLPGLIISGLSIIVMYFVYRLKMSTGDKLNSDAIIADAYCTKSCMLLSIVLLLSSGLYEILHLGYVDIIGSLVISWLIYKEGKESLEKMKNNSLLCKCVNEIKS